MAADFSQNHFALFGLPLCFAIDETALDSAFRRLQGEVHPDRHAHRSDAEKRLALQWATHANAAYQTLKKPLARARYLLAQHGIDTEEESNTAMPVAFLMAQMEWREACADARAAGDIAALEHLAQTLKHDMAALITDISHALDITQEFSAAAELVRKCRFLDKQADDIAHAIEALLY